MQAHMDRGGNCLTLPLQHRVQFAGGVAALIRFTGEQQARSLLAETFGKSVHMTEAVVFGSPYSTLPEVVDNLDKLVAFTPQTAADWATYHLQWFLVSPPLWTTFRLILSGHYA